MGLDFSLQVVAIAMEGPYSSSLSYMPWGFSPRCIECTALLLGVPFYHNSSSGQVLWEIEFDQAAFWITNPLERVPLQQLFFFFLTVK